MLCTCLWNHFHCVPWVWVHCVFIVIQFKMFFILFHDFCLDSIFIQQRIAPFPQVYKMPVFFCYWYPALVHGGQRELFQFLAPVETALCPTTWLHLEKCATEHIELLRRKCVPRCLDETLCRCLLGPSDFMMLFNSSISMFSFDLVLNSWSSWFYLPNFGITGICHHTISVLGFLRIHATQSTFFG